MFNFFHVFSMERSKHYFYGNCAYARIELFNYSIFVIIILYELYVSSKINENLTNHYVDGDNKIDI